MIFKLGDFILAFYATHKQSITSEFVPITAAAKLKEQ